MPHPDPTSSSRPADRARVSETIVQRARDLGFALAGVVTASPSSYQQQFREWLQSGCQGEMGYLERNVEERLDPGRFQQNARSILLVADQYADRADDANLKREPGLSGGARGRIARYARGEDYHLAMKKRLHLLCDALRGEYPDEVFRAFVDTAPILEREHAARAGMGWIGKHTLLIHPRRGSWLLLGGIVTTLELVPPRTQRVEPDRCGSCTRCIDACPTDAISPYRVDASRCISYLTIEHRSPIPREFFSAIGDWIFGCDICQEVCPHNSTRTGRVPSGRAHPAYAERTDSFDLLEVLGWTEEDRRLAFAKSALKRAKLDMMKRNAVIAAGNLLRSREDPDLRAKITHLAYDREESGQVRDAARTVLDLLGQCEDSGRPASPEQCESRDSGECE